ncbi:type VI secretion system-associated protein TagO [Achromobacter sp. NPDC058515]|uniref:type VI secretion system-associated protein TagO n=1 Tax=Achromobacter sp. NPDC058515 TaxID=3346533 RepID=UPI0036507FFA
MRNVILLAGLCTPLLAHAVEDNDIATCAAMSSTVSRLVCFDQLAARSNLAPATRNTTASGSGKWKTSRNVDPLNDREIHYAMLVADSGSGKYGDPIMLAARCRDNKTELYINWSSFLGSDSIKTIYRVDKAEAQSAHWSLSTDKQAAFFPKSPVALLKQMVESQTFVANLTPYNESPITATFDTSGADVALRDIRAACKW